MKLTLGSEKMTQPLFTHLQFNADPTGRYNVCFKSDVEVILVYLDIFLTC